MRRKFATLLGVAALLGSMLITSNIVLAGNPSATLDQCANGQTPSPSTDGCDTNANQWVNGNLNASKSVYNEGDSIPYRMTFGSLALASHTVTIEWDTTKAGKHAIDYLTTWNRTVGNSNPCLGVANCVLADGVPFAIPKDPQVDPGTPSGSGASGGQLAGNFTIWGGNITAVSAYSYSTGTGFAGDKSASIVITFTATRVNPVLAWGGHIATRLDWGIDFSAVAISGSPYHTRLLDLDGSGGNQDRSLSADAVVFPGSITIIKDATPNGSTSFPFTATPSPLSGFSLVDDGTSANTKVFSDIKTSTSITFAVTETPIPSGWAFDAVSCSVTSGNGGSATPSGAAVSITLKEGENWTCTYTNHQLNPALTIAKTVTGVDTDTTAPFEVDAAGDVISYSIRVTNTGNQTLTGVFVSDPRISNLDCNPSLAGNQTTGFTLAQSAFITCTGTYTVLQSDIDNNGGGDGDIDNTATADSDQTGPITDSAAVPLSQGAALNITKTVKDVDGDTSDPVVDQAGDVIHYTITVANTGNVTLTGITVTDPFADAGSIVRDALDVVGDEDNLLEVGETWGYTAAHTVTQAELDAGGNYDSGAPVGNDSLRNVSTADSNETGPDTDDAIAPVDRNPALSVVKTADQSTYDKVGNVLTYTIVVTNEGNTTLTGVSVVDANVTDIDCDGEAGAPFVATGLTIAVGAFITCTASHTVTQADLDAGFYYNNACADDGPGNAAEDCDDANVPADQNPALDITKVDDLDGGKFENIGDVITYTIVATNIGNVTLHDVVVTDAQVSDLVCDPEIPVDDLAPGDTIECTASHTINQDDLDAGHFYNQACVDDAVDADADEACDDVDSPGKAQPTIVTADQFIPQDSITLGGISGSTTGGNLYVELRINADCGAVAAPAWSHTWSNAGNATYDTSSIAVQPDPISTDAIVRWCTSYSGNADNAARPLLSRSEISQIDFDPFGVAAFGAAIPMLAWALWSRRKREEKAA